MKAMDLLQRLQLNRDEAVICYPPPLRNDDERAWIVSRQGIVTHRACVDRALVELVSRRWLRQVSCQWPSRARVYRPVTDWKDGA
jgi:hypothetical protein